MFRTSVYATAAVLCLCAAASWGQDRPEDVKIEPLRIGDTAPEIDIAHWLKGEKVERFQADKIYVIEFWATWCSPCRASIPKLSELQKNYRDYGVRVIGVSDEELAEVVKFTCGVADEEGRTWEKKVDYSLTTDPDRSVYERFMHGVGATAIPTAFIIGKDSKLEWVGHPLEIDRPLDAVVKGEWDRRAFAEKFDPEAELNRQKMLERLRAIAQLRPHEEALKRAIDEGDVQAALTTLDTMMNLDRNPAGPALTKFKVLLKDFNKPDLAYKYGDEFTRANWDNASLLNQIAWFGVDHPGVQHRDFDFLLKTTKRAVELTEEKDPAILDTLARVYYEKGDLRNAVRYQKLAFERSEPGPMAEGIADTLKRYEDELARSG